ncbi:CU044_2847 family protein [Streptomyces sp. NPDC060235]|uniref:CU044_2847 family protein n=1 Tax=Streptomyces sp. NPDC060235 TaxID=3347080 RepID=UPI00365EE033
MQVSEHESVELVLPDGALVVVQAARLPASEQIDELDRDGSGPVNVGLREALSFSSVSTAMRGVAGEIHRAFQTAKPDVAEVEFGFDFAMKGSQLLCVLLDGEAKASIRVRLEWRNPASGDGN